MLNIFWPGPTEILRISKFNCAHRIQRPKTHINGGFRIAISKIFKKWDSLTWSKLLDDSIPVDVVYLDFKKPFDSVPHKRMLNTLRSYEIVGKLLAWIQ